MQTAYAGARAVLTTKHGKGRAIAPALLETAGIHVTAIEDVDTDALGTFTGEVERPGTMLETAIAKARLGMAATGTRIGLASEGSFGPHPAVPFLAAGLELLVLVDDATGAVIREERLVEDTNFGHLVVGRGDAYRAWLERVGFPSHAVIVRANAGASHRATAKGLTDARDVERAVRAAARASSDGRARIETDMRAHVNPTRMRSLEDVARSLGVRLATPCPACAAPGFGRDGIVPGLPCGWCGLPTDLILAERWTCHRCGRQEARPRPDGLQQADPGSCPRCNP